MEVWLPWIRIIGAALVAIALLWLAFRRQKYRRGWAMLSVRVLSALGSLPVLLFSLFLLSAQSCASHGPLIGSPDGKHVARELIYGNVPAGSSIDVVERASWSPAWESVGGAASVGTPLEPIEPIVSWADDSHLILNFPNTEPGTGHGCIERRVGTVQIVCRTHMREAGK